MEVLNERNKTHGNFDDNAIMSQRIKYGMRHGAPIVGSRWDALTPDKREALEMIALKISRILTGNSDEPDHWRDIAGYASLISERLERAK
jgi:hypothetical protein